MILSPFLISKKAHFGLTLSQSQLKSSAFSSKSQSTTTNSISTKPTSAFTSHAIFNQPPIPSHLNAVSQLPIH